MNTFNIPHEVAAKFLADSRNRRLATEENVMIAMDLISQAGANPSIRNVQHVLGGGLARDLSKWLNANKTIGAERNPGQPVAQKIALSGETSAVAISKRPALFLPPKSTISVL